MATGQQHHLQGSPDRCCPEGLHLPPSARPPKCALGPEKNLAKFTSFWLSSDPCPCSPDGSPHEHTHPSFHEASGQAREPPAGPTPLEAVARKAGLFPAYFREAEGKSQDH